jgi:hypothetical protein
MASLSFKTKTGKRVVEVISQNRNVFDVLRGLGIAGTAARMGVEKRENSEWKAVPLSYVVQPSDELRVRYPAKTSLPNGLVQLMTDVLSQIRPRPNSNFLRSSVGAPRSAPSGTTPKKKP